MRAGFDEQMMEPSGRTMLRVPLLKLRKDWKLRLHLSAGSDARLPPVPWPSDVPERTMRARRSGIEPLMDSAPGVLAEPVLPAARPASNRALRTLSSRARL